MKPEGRKEVTEAVLIAALSALCGAAITWGAEEAKKALAARREAQKKPDEPKTEQVP